MNDPDLLALLAVVIERPDEAAPRLVTADWLAERGDDAEGAMRWAAVRMEDGMRKPHHTEAKDSAAWFYVRDHNLLYYELPVALYAFLSGDKKVTQHFTYYQTDAAAWLALLEAWRRCPHGKRPKVRKAATAS